MNNFLSSVEIRMATGINEQTFFQRVKLRGIKSVTFFSKRKYYSVKDWNEKCPDYKVVLDK